MVWIGKELKTHPVLPLPWAGAPSTVPGSSKPNPVWPWTLPKIQGQPQLLWAACHVIGITLFNTLLCVAEPQSRFPWNVSSAHSAQWVLGCGWDRAEALKLHNCSSRVLFLVFMKNILQFLARPHWDLGGLLVTITGWCGLVPHEAAVGLQHCRIGVSPRFVFLEVPS